MDQKLIKHPNARRSWVAVRVNRHNTNIVLVVETDLILNPDHEGHDVSAFTSLVEEVRQLLLTRPYINSADIEPVVRDNA